MGSLDSRHGFSGPDMKLPPFPSGSANGRTQEGFSEARLDTPGFTLRKERGRFC